MHVAFRVQAVELARHCCTDTTTFTTHRRLGTLRIAASPQAVTYQGAMLGVHMLLQGCWVLQVTAHQSVRLEAINGTVGAVAGAALLHITEADSRAAHLRCA